MHTRQNALNKWLKTLFGDEPFTLTPLAGDASFRRYFRLKQGESTRVVMDAPPERESVTAFINIGNKLAATGVRTPIIYATDQTQGFILLEDLGDHLLWQALVPDQADLLYTTAMNTLLQIQKCPPANPELRHFDKALMLQQLALFQEWFLHAYLGLKLEAHEEDLLAQTFDWLTTQIATQPQVFVHGDYHSRNIMIIGQQTLPELGVIDFQDAVCGPFTLDLVSLLKDCYIQWPREQVIHWMTYFYNHLPNAQSWSLAEFTRAFDLCGLQRHLRVLGVFCRLHLRDHKPSYLRDLPLTFNYVNACLESYRELQPLYHFMQQRVFMPFAEKQLS